MHWYSGTVPNYELMLHAVQSMLEVPPFVFELHKTSSTQLPKKWEEPITIDNRSACCNWSLIMKLQLIPLTLLTSSCPWGLSAWRRAVGRAGPRRSRPWRGWNRAGRRSCSRSCSTPGWSRPAARPCAESPPSPWHEQGGWWCGYTKQQQQQ